MSVGRLIRKNLLASPKFRRMSEGAQLWLMGLIVISDDFGRGHGDSELIKNELSPLQRFDVTEADRRLGEIAQAFELLFYEDKSEKYYYFANWFDLQKFNSNCHIAPTEIPNPPSPSQKYTDGCVRNCRFMLNMGYADPDAIVPITDIFPPDWDAEDR